VEFAKNKETAIKHAAKGVGIYWRIGIVYSSKGFNEAIHSIKKRLESKIPFYLPAAHPETEFISSRKKC
jgi:hypothetical protein